MATTVLLDCKIFLGGYNLSGFHNSIDMAYAPEMLDDTVFGTSGTRSSKPGLLTFEATGSIFWDTSIDGVIYDRIGAQREVMSYAAEGNTGGDVGFTTRGVNGTYNPLSGEVGQLMQSEFTARASNTPLVRGRVLISPATITGAGTGTAAQVGAATATQRVYAALHVTEPGGGGSITVTVSSGTSSGTAGTTTRFSFTAASAAGAQWMELAGPITDQWWQASWTASGTISAFLIVGVK
jgi:hypothetical protein